MTQTLVLDNGAFNMKVGIASVDATPRLVPNAIVRGKADKRNYIADEFDNCTDFSSLYYRLPFERGLLTSWGFERSIWDRTFKHAIGIDPQDTRLLITEPCFNLPTIQDGYDQVVFEEYEFASCYRTIAPELCLFNELADLFGDKKGSVPECVLLVDSGYSFTYIVPFLKGKAVSRGIRRLDVGGKLLTNYLKEVVSFRYYDMMEETYIMNDVKEQCSYISKDVYKDLDICKNRGSQNTIIQEYVLPDFIHTTKGHIRTPDSPKTADQQILPMNNERFMVPEILMHPSDIGIDQAGIPEAIKQSVESCDTYIQGLLYANIVLVGGNANIPGYMDRIKHELRQLIPDEFRIRIATPPNPVTFAWEGGNHFSNFGIKSVIQKSFVTRQDYEEYGSEICRQKFGSVYR